MKNARHQYVEQWNDGKQAEFADRKTYSVKPVVHA